MARNLLPVIEPGSRDHSPFAGRWRALALLGSHLHVKDPRLRISLSRQLEVGPLVDLGLLLPHPPTLQSSINS